MCDHIAEGDSVQTAAKLVGVAYKTFYNILAQGDESIYANTLIQAYARARKCRADARAEQIDEIVRRTMLPKDAEEYLEPNAARVVIDAIKWQAGKENNARYGDRLAIEDNRPKAITTREEALATLASSGLSVADIFGALTKPVQPLPVALEIEAGADQDQDDSEELGG
jgi:DNA-binding NarL/FixJ family response regulator